MITVHKTGKLFDSNFDEVAGLSIEYINKKPYIKGTVHCNGGNKPTLLWDLEGNSYYKDSPSLDMKNIKIKEE